MTHQLELVLIHMLAEGVIEDYNIDGIIEPINNKYGDE